MDDDYGEGLGPVLLPITVAEDFYPGLNFDNPLFGMRQKDFPLEEKAAERLEMTSAKTTAGLERFAIDLRTRHELILNGYATERMLSLGSDLCRSTSTPVKTAHTNLRRLYTAVKRPNAQSVTASAWHRSSRCLP